MKELKQFLILLIFILMFFVIKIQLDKISQLQTETNLLLGTQNCYMLNDTPEAFWKCVNDKQDK